MLSLLHLDDEAIAVRQPQIITHRNGNVLVEQPVLKEGGCGWAVLPFVYVKKNFTLFSFFFLKKNHSILN